MKNKSLAIGVLILLGVLMASASPTHRALAQPGDVAELKVTIREWSVPTKGAHPQTRRSAQTAPCGSPSR